MKTIRSFMALAAAITLSVAIASASETEDFADRFMIEELMYRYALAHDLTDPEAYAAVFAEDGELVAGGIVVAKGREALMAQAVDDRERYNPGARDGERSFMVMRHIITNPVITLNGDGTASGICYSQIVVQEPGVGPQILSQGRYEDEYVKQDGEWFISRREIFIADMANYELAAEIGIGGQP